MASTVNLPMGGRNYVVKAKAANAAFFMPILSIAPSLKLAVAAVVSFLNNGTIFVRWDTGRRLQDLHDVEANGGKNNEDILHWNASASRWETTDRLTLLEDRVAALEAMI